MSKVQMLRASVNQRLSAAAAEIFWLFERTVAELEEQLCRSHEENERQQKLLDAVLRPQVRILGADVQQLVVSEEEVPEQQQEEQRSPSEEQEEPPHMKEEQEEELGALQEASFVRRGEGDGEKPQSSQFHSSQAEDFNALSRNAVDDGWGEGGAKPFCCLQCGKRFTQKGTLQRHLRCHTGEKPFACSVCNRRFSQKVTLTRHMTVHMREKPFSCSAADRQFSRYSCEGGDGEKPQFSQLHQSQTEENRECGGPQPDRNLNQDLHLQPGSFVRSYPRPETADRNYYWMQNREPQAGFNTLNHNNAVNNVGCQSGAKPTFSCSECGKIFTQKGTLQRHLRRHRGEKPFICSVCGRQFGQKVTLNRHMTIHTGEKPFSCFVCGKRFSRQSRAENHTCVVENAGSLQQMYGSEELLKSNLV